MKIKSFFLRNLVYHKFLTDSGKILESDLSSGVQYTSKLTRQLLGLYHFTFYFKRFGVCMLLVLF